MPAVYRSIFLTWYVSAVGSIVRGDGHIKDFLAIPLHFHHPGLDLLSVPITPRYNVIHRNAILAQHTSKVDVEITGLWQLVHISQEGGVGSRPQVLAILPELFHRPIYFVDAIDHRPGVIISRIYAASLRKAPGLAIIEKEDINGIRISIRIRQGS